MNFGKNFPRQRPGAPIVARTINAPVGALESLSRLGVGKGLVQAVVNGIPLLWAKKPQRQWARITGSDGGTPPAYTWRGVYGTAGGGWSDLPGNVSDNAGKDPAFEANGVATVPAGTFVELWREPYTGEFRYQLSSCP